MVDILEKELSYAAFAVESLKSETKVFEKAYKMSSNDFMVKFEKGKLGDEKEWFTWYGLVLSIKDWDDTKKEITKTLRTA